MKKTNSVRKQNSIKKHNSSNIDNIFDQNILDNGKNAKSRDYQCGCGKKYLGYAALFTH